MLDMLEDIVMPYTFSSPLPMQNTMMEIYLKRGAASFVEL